MKAIALSALLIATPALSADGDIERAAKIHWLFVEASVAEKFCPNLAVDNDKLFEEMSAIGASKTSELIEAFEKTSQGQAYLESRVNAFKQSKDSRAMWCKVARTAPKLQGIVVEKKAK